MIIETIVAIITVFTVGYTTGKSVHGPETDVQYFDLLSCAKNICARDLEYSFAYFEHSDEVMIKCKDDNGNRQVHTFNSRELDTCITKDF